MFNSKDINNKNWRADYNIILTNSLITKKIKGYEILVFSSKTINQAFKCSDNTQREMNERNQSCKL